MAALPAEIPRDPAHLLEETFRRIGQERMSDHPFLNRNLEVEAVGFRMFEGHWIGVLITPWFLNLIILPGSGEQRVSYVEGRVREWRFPGGAHTFRNDREKGLGEYETCPVLPSVIHLPDQDHARRAAEAVLRVLFDPPAAELQPGNRNTAPSPSEPTPAGPKSMARLFSRRSFLRGAMFRD